MAKGLTNGLTAGYIQVNGKTAICMVMESTNGPMAQIMKDTITTMSEKVTAHLLGLTVVSMMANGKTGRCMGKGCIEISLVKSSRGFGSKAQRPMRLCNKINPD